MVRAIDSYPIGQGFDPPRRYLFIMRIDVLTCLPDLLTSFMSYSIIKRAIDSKLLEINVHNLHDFAEGKHKKTDDYAYSGIPGLVMKIEPIDKCIEFLKKNNSKPYDEVIYLCPDGEILNQEIVNNLSKKDNIIILCGHYKGIDERVRENYITREISIGEYVLSGGEIPACVLIDSIVRLIPGAINDINSALDDSFQSNYYIAPPVFTRPREYKGLKVPDILLSGNTKLINEWLLSESKKREEKYRKLNSK